MDLIAIIVSIAALMVVIYQTWVTREALSLTRRSLNLTGDSLDATKKSMDATNRSTELAIRTMQIDMLPRANWVIHVQIALEQWIDDLKSTIETASDAERKLDQELLYSLAQKGLKDPKGLVSRDIVERTPIWLSTILLSGAQYYYDAKAPQTGLWKDHDNTPWFDFIPRLISRCQDSIEGLQQLLKMIDDVVPAAYLNSPASLSDERFLD